MKKYDAVTLAIAAAGAIGAMLLASPDASAGPDPRVPQPFIGYCPGGGTGGYGPGFCDGAEYPDGTFWHTARGVIPFAGFQTTLFCAANHDFMPAPAGPRGCGQ